MLKMYVKFQNLLRKEEGQGLVEYGMIIGLIALAAIAAVTALGPKISSLFEGITAKLPTTTP